MEKMNREQRRREKFGHAGGVTKEPWPQSEANPAFGHAGTPEAAEEASGDPVPATEEPPQVDDKGATPKASAKG
jgi:hypothetical protein